MRKRVYAGMTLAALFSGQALANEKLTLVLDWYINPDHAPILVAEQIGAFKDAGLDVKCRRPTRRCRRGWSPPARRTWRLPTSRRCIFC
jgi:putative hydroxymethylpyrimidine transport system substrate-binding protein